MIEFPVLNNFYYKDELDASTSEIIYTKQSFNLLGDTMDDNLKKNLKCKAFQDLMEIHNDSGLKFINKNSTKKYYLKITRYRRGKTLLLKDDNFNFVYKLLDGDRKKLVIDIKNQSCGNYRYFTGDFEFIPKEITIP
ncbi:MAG: hypothetical protein K0M56_02560 [Kaistella sp.]|nr:hypothetical protein [Kaistella sp.]